jgi:curli biogenesis system outer membrane secretion channel CsgG
MFNPLRGALIGKQKTQRARARVVLRLVDLKTGEVFYTQEGSGEATLTASSTDAPYGFCPTALILEL